MASLLRPQPSMFKCAPTFARTFATARPAPSAKSAIAQLRAKLPRRSIALAAPQQASYQAGAGYGPEFWKRAAVAGGAVIAGTVGLNAVLNRETRGALAPTEREHLQNTFKYMAVGLGVVAATAVGLHRSGMSYRIALKMQTSPWLVMGASLAGCIGTMILVRSISPEQTVAKLLAFAAFNSAQAVLLSPMLFFAPALLGRAALYTAGLIGSLCYIGVTAKSDAYLYMGGALMAGLVVVALSSLAPLLLPATATTAISLTTNISMYGGLAVFGGLTLYDCQKILAHARQAEAMGQVDKLDPASEAISLILDFINIAIRMVMILSGGSGNRRR